MTIIELKRQYESGTITPTQVVEASLECIKTKDTEIHAFLDVYDDVLESANLATEAYRQGKSVPILTGIPLAVKNNILIKGRRATAASKILENYVATYDATIIKSLNQAGALFVGATNLDEFAMGNSTENSAFGATKNPIDKTRVPGGSSGGSAAAVAMGAVPAAIGTDTGGSIRQPASFCGLVGLKPTYGAVSRNGLIAMGSSFDQAGPLTNTVTDAELLFKIMSGTDPKDMTSISETTYPGVLVKDKYRVGIPRDFLQTGVDKDVLEVFETEIERLVAAGHEVVDISLPLFKQGLAAYYIAIPAEVSSNLARYDGIRYGIRANQASLLDVYEHSRASGLGKEVKRRILLGTYVLSSGYYDAYYGKAEAVRALMRTELDTTFKDIDLVLTPTAPTPAFRFGEHDDPLSSYAQDIFTVPVNLTGVPAISIPAGTVDRDGVALPVGVQYISPHAGEARLFDIGKRQRQEV